MASAASCRSRAEINSDPRRVRHRPESRPRKILSVAVYNHYKRLDTRVKQNDVELAKSNVLLIGPNRQRQDSARGNARAAVECALYDRRCHHPD